MHMDTQFVRTQFPALAGDWVFFDNAGGSQILSPVLERIVRYLSTSNVQLGASYEVSRMADERVAAAARAMRVYVNAEHDGEVVMGPSTSMLLRTLALCLSETFSPGDEIIVTNCDHEANIGPWMDLERKGMIIKKWKLNRDTLQLHPSDLEALMTERTRLVALTHASNILGSINPIREIARTVHERGAMICVDGVAYAPHRRIDVQALGVDFYAFSFYKVYGPHYALLYGRREHLLRIPGINHFFIGMDSIPYKFQPGNVNYELSYGMTGIWDYLAAFARAHGRPDLTDDGGKLADFVFATIARHEELLNTRLIGYLSNRSDVRIIGQVDCDPLKRVPTVSFVVGDRPSDRIVAEVDPHRIGIRFGDFYARRLIDDLGLARQNGVVRVSMVHYNTLEEVDRLIAVFDRIL